MYNVYYCSIKDEFGFTTQVLPTLPPRPLEVFKSNKNFEAESYLYIYINRTLFAPFTLMFSSIEFKIRKVALSICPLM